jgi:hypothetical protein
VPTRSPSKRRYRNTVPDIRTLYRKVVHVMSLNMVISVSAYNTFHRAMSEMSYGSQSDWFYIPRRRPGCRYPIKVGDWLSNTLSIDVYDRMTILNAELDIDNLVIYITIRHPSLGIQCASVRIPKPPVCSSSMQTRINKNKIIIETALPASSRNTYIPACLRKLVATWF